ncbi:MAG: ATP-binding protein, partial [Euryarchaeota archaeon]|nr:ATP-binding protein [Euryarchaeota archaeon]
EYKNEFININPKIFAILSPPLRRNIDRLNVKEEFAVLFLNSKKGNELKNLLNNKINFVYSLLKKYNLYLDLTPFQSNLRGSSKSKFITNDEVHRLLLEHIEKFPASFYDSIIELNKKVSFFNDLLNSIENYKIRDKINNEYSDYFNECKELIDKLKEEKITTSFDSSNPPYFKIIDEQKFKNKIIKLKQEYIDKISDPIIDNLLDGSSIRPPVTPPHPPIIPPQPPVVPPRTPVIPPQPHITPLQSILAGFECGTGDEVKIKPAHLFISGLTQKSGKTTTLEALIQRSGLSTISFITKPGEKCFDKGENHKPFFQEKAEWKVVEKLFESQLGEKMKDVRAKLIELCKNEKTLKTIKHSIDIALEDSKGTERKSLILLQAYFEDLFKELENKEYTSNLSLKTGINLMDLSSYNEELQSYIINSVLNEILHNNKNTVVIIPEAWKFIPQSKRTPSKYSIEQLIRQGAVNNNFVWFDSQDIAGVDKSILKSVSIWMLGLQTEVNEVEHTIAQIPLPKGQRPTNDQIMNLQVGEFFACFDGKCIKTYVMPNWMSENEAKEIAKSKKHLNS